MSIDRVVIIRPNDDLAAESGDLDATRRLQASLLTFCGV